MLDFKADFIVCPDTGSKVDEVTLNFKVMTVIAAKNSTVFFFIAETILASPHALPDSFPLLASLSN